MKIIRNIIISLIAVVILFVPKGVSASETLSNYTFGTDISYTFTSQSDYLKVPFSITEKGYVTVTRSYTYDNSESFRLKIQDTAGNTVWSAGYGPSGQYIDNLSYYVGLEPGNYYYIVQSYYLYFNSGSTTTITTSLSFTADAFCETENNSDSLGSNADIIVYNSACRGEVNANNSNYDWLDNFKFKIISGASYTVKVYSESNVDFSDKLKIYLETSTSTGHSDITTNALSDSGYTFTYSSDANDIGEARVFIDYWSGGDMPHDYIITIETNAVGWVKSAAGNWYYIDNYSNVATDWKKIGNNWYYFDSDGVMQSGKWIGNYYLKADGSMAVSEWIGNYYVGADGAWVQPKWICTNGRWWYRHADGSYTKNNWELIDNVWYHFDASGYMQTGWKQINSTWYYFGNNGAMATGWKQINSTWYYFGNNGAMATGWRQINGKYYYFYSSGAMASNTWIGNYYVNASGVWTSSK